MDRSSATLKLLLREECCEIMRNDFHSQGINRWKLKTYEIKKSSNELVGFMGDYYKLELEIEKQEEKAKEVNKYKF